MRGAVSHHLWTDWVWKDAVCAGRAPVTRHGYYRDAFEVIFILCPTCERNCTYRESPWLHAKRFVFINPGEGYTIACGLSSVSSQTRPRCT